MAASNNQKINTLGALKKSGYRPRSIKEELRANLIAQLKSGKKNIFSGIYGYDDSVIPDIEKAILSRHNIILLGLRGQAKTRLARLMTNLLDEYIPVVEGAELNDDPLNPISRFAKDLIADHGDLTPVSWMHREARYTEKLATPDVTIADLIGDLDPIRAATLKLPYSDERVIHYGLIPHSHRCIFVINELPDLQPRIQVALFNILQEGDIQIRGFRIRLPLDLQFVFTANPEDYTSRGTIVTPLKDRIESQILTHYPRDIATGRSITSQESRLAEEQSSAITIPDLLSDLIEQIAVEARKSEFVDMKSGVSARLTITALQNLASTVERRIILNKEKIGQARLQDLWGVVPSITGKVELVYEGEQEGSYLVALNLIASAIKTVFLERFPDPEKLKKKDQTGPYEELLEWFSAGNNLDLLNDLPEAEFKNTLGKLPGIKPILKKFAPGVNSEDQYLMTEIILHGLAETGQLQRSRLERGNRFQDPLNGMFSVGDIDEEELSD